MSKIIRRHRNRTPDDKGDRRLIGGIRWRIPKGSIHSESDYGLRFDRIERLWRDNEKLGDEWSPVAMYAAEQFRLGADRIPLPDLDTIFESFWDHHAVRRINVLLIEDESVAPGGEVSDLDYDLVMGIFDLLLANFPSVPWQLPRPQQEEIVASHERQARRSTEQYAIALGAAPPDPKTPLVNGTLHEAIRAYRVERKKKFEVSNGELTQSGHSAIGLIDDLLKRHKDFPLSLLDHARCRQLIEYWTSRPPHLKKNKEVPDTHLAHKTCRNHLVELDLFLKWLHLSDKFNWRRPIDFQDIERTVRHLPSDRKSITQMEQITFRLDDLRKLYAQSTLRERLLLVWCLNCSHGAGEFGRVEWEDLYLNQPHPWVSQGLKLECSEADSWCGLLRPKTDVLGWWWLFPETVELLNWWKSESQSYLKKPLMPSHRVLITEKGHSLYRDGSKTANGSSKNAQTGFSNAWKRLLTRVNKSDQQVPRLSFGTLRQQLANWLGGEENQAILASVALAHGIPHRGDKLLFQHYSNKPWAALFNAQRRWREYLQPMFDELPSVVS